MSIFWLHLLKPESLKLLLKMREILKDKDALAARKLIDLGYKNPGSPMHLMLNDIAECAAGHWTAEQAGIWALMGTSYPVPITLSLRRKDKECRCDARQLLWYGHDKGCAYMAK